MNVFGRTKVKWRSHLGLFAVYGTLGHVKCIWNRAYISSFILFDRERAFKKPDNDHFCNSVLLTLEAQQ